MVRHLLLVRHAKSDWGDPALSDFDRPLNARGKRDAPVMGKRLAASGTHLDRMVSSPAKRARSTAKAIACGLGFPVRDVEWINELYQASPSAILQIIRTCPKHVTTLALVGHNPGISELARELCSEITEEMPTCSIVHLTGKFDSWDEADSNFSLLDFDYPKRKA
jgi:phosphohistidine phosphatase